MWKSLNSFLDVILGLFMLEISLSDSPIERSWITFDAIVVRINSISIFKSILYCIYWNASFEILQHDKFMCLFMRMIGINEQFQRFDARMGDIMNYSLVKLLKHYYFHCGTKRLPKLSDYEYISIWMSAFCRNRFS